MALPLNKKSTKRAVSLFKTTTKAQADEPSETSSLDVTTGLMRKKSRSSSTSEEVSSTTDEADVSPTSVGSPVISVSAGAIMEAVDATHDGNNNNSSSNALETMNASIDLAGNSNGDFDVPMNDDFDVPVKVDDYGYGNAAPDDKTNYGYGDAGPDDRSQYGYGDAAPDDKSKYGYGDATPDDKSKYGYEEAAPSLRKVLSRRPRRRRTCGAEDDDDLSCDSSGPSVCSSLGSTRSTMRSSMKKHGSSSSTRRRASIQFGSEINVYLPGHEKPVKRRTSITFNESVRVKNVNPVRNMTDAPEKLWFQDDEFKAIRRRSLDLVDKVDSGETNGKKYCIRGLEKLTKSRRKQVLERKYSAWDTVLDEQDVQRDSGTWDEDYMANAYKYITQEPQEEAVRQGRKDYDEIENYMRSTRRICRRLSM